MQRVDVPQVKGDGCWVLKECLPLSKAVSCFVFIVKSCSVWKEVTQIGLFLLLLFFFHFCISEANSKMTLYCFHYLSVSAPSPFKKAIVAF